MPATAAATSRTVFARNLRRRTPLAVIALNGKDLPSPIFGAAYVREEGIVTIALSNGHHLEMRNRDQVTVTYEPETYPGVKGLRRCRGNENHPAHLRRIGTDPSATAYCDHNVKALKADNRKAPGSRTNWASDKKAAKKAAADARITHVMEGTARGRAALEVEAQRAAVPTNLYAQMWG